MGGRPSSIELALRKALRVPHTHALTPWTLAARHPVSVDTVSLAATSISGSISTLHLPTTTDGHVSRSRRVERNDGFRDGTLSISAHADCDNGRGGISVTAKRAPAPVPAENAFLRLWRRVRRREEPPAPPAPPKLKLSAKRTGSGRGRYEAVLSLRGGDAELNRTPGEDAQLRVRMPPLRGKTLCASTRVNQRKGSSSMHASGEARISWEQSEIRLRCGKTISLSARRQELAFRLERGSHMVKIGPVELAFGSSGPSANVKSPFGVTIVAPASLSHTRVEPTFFNVQVGSCPALIARRKVGKQDVTFSINQALAVETSVDQKGFRAQARVAAPRTGWKVGRGDKEQWVAVVRFGWFL